MINAPPPEIKSDWNRKRERGGGGNVREKDDQAKLDGNGRTEKQIDRLRDEKCIRE